MRAETSTLSEELLLLKKESEGSAKVDTQKADLRDKYNALVLENKMLQKQIDGKFSAERFNQAQELENAKRDLSLTQAKNKQLETRIATLESRLDGQQDSEIVE